MLTAKRTLHFNTDSRGRKTIDREPKPKPVVPERRVPRVAKLLVLAIPFQQRLDDGVVADESDLARLSHAHSPESRKS